MGVTAPRRKPRLAGGGRGLCWTPAAFPPIPSPSQEGAPLPAEEASTPPTLPLPHPRPLEARHLPPSQPRPVTAAAAPLSWRLQGVKMRDTTEATSGVFTDLSSDGPQAEK